MFLSYIRKIKFILFLFSLISTSISLPSFILSHLSQLFSYIHSHFLPLSLLLLKGLSEIELTFFIEFLHNFSEPVNNSRILQEWNTESVCLYVEFLFVSSYHDIFYIYNIFKQCNWLMKNFLRFLRLQLYSKWELHFHWIVWVFGWKIIEVLVRLNYLILLFQNHWIILF